MFSKANVLIITNNSKVIDRYKYNFALEYVESADMLAVLIKTRDYMHKGYTLLTHPLSGSLKPNQTPYKSILLLSEDESLDFEKLQLIENSIETFYKFFENTNISKWSDKIKADFETIDLSLISSCLEKYT